MPCGRRTCRGVLEPDNQGYGPRSGVNVKLALTGLTVPYISSMVCTGVGDVVVTTGVDAGLTVIGETAVLLNPEPERTVNRAVYWPGVV